MNRWLILMSIFALAAACDFPPKQNEEIATGEDSATSASSPSTPTPAGNSQKGFRFQDRWDAERAQDLAKKPFDIDAYYKLRRMSELTWSPDGNRVLFVVTSHNLHDGETRSHIWMATPEKGALQQLTRGEVRDWSPRWRPDGQAFLFSSTRSEDTQIWTMPINGGEPAQLTTLATGVQGATWSPDGKSIAFVSEVFPEFGADAEANRTLLDDIENSPTQAHIADHLFFRHWTSWEDGRRNHILLQDVATKEIRDLTPGDFDSPASDGHGSAGFAFSPNGEKICFASNRTSPDEQAWNTNKDLFEVELGGGALRSLTESNPAFDAHPSYGPSNDRIAFLRQSVPGYESAQMQLALLNPANGQSSIATKDFDNWVLGFRWTNGGKSIVFRAPEKGHFRLFRLALDSGSPERLDEIPSTLSWDVNERGDVVFTSSAVGRPEELFVRQATTGRVDRLTTFNDTVRDQYDIRPAEEMWVEGAAGRKVHVFIVKPHGFTAGKTYPLILNVHGGPQYQWADSFRGDWQMYPGSGYVVAFPNPHGSTGYGQAYTAGISKDYTGKVMEDIMAVTDALAKLDYVDEERMGAMGWSWGGYAVSWLLGRSERFKALAAMMPVYDLRSFYGATDELWFPEYDIGKTPWENPDVYRNNSPSTYAANFKTPTLVLTGERDFRVPYTQGLQLFTALRRQDVPARLVVFSNDGHWPNHAASMPLYYAAHLDWFHEHLGGDPSPYDPRAMVRGRAYSKTPSTPSKNPTTQGIRSE